MAEGPGCWLKGCLEGLVEGRGEWGGKNERLGKQSIVPGINKGPFRSES